MSRSRNIPGPRMGLGVRGYRIAVAVLALALIALLAKVVVSGTTAPGPDGRTQVQLDAAEHSLVLAEMRGFVAGLAHIDTALGAGRRDEAARASRALGMAATHDAPVALLARLPLPFKTLAFGTHRGFDALADDIDHGAPVTAILARRGELLGQCVACHADYALGGVR